MQGVRRHLNYANVVATVALIVATAGSAYAIDRVGTQDVKNNSLRSADLKNGNGVAARDVKRNSLGGSELRESRLDTGQMIRATGDSAPLCEPVDASVEPTACAAVSVGLPQSMNLQVTATGAVASSGTEPASATCTIRIDGTEEGVLLSPGEKESVNTSSLATDGFAATYASDSPLQRGSHLVELACAQPGQNDITIEDPSIAVLAVGAPKP